jgi:hypothetical protein
MDDQRFVVTAQLFCEFFKRREGDELLREASGCSIEKGAWRCMHALTDVEGQGQGQKERTRERETALSAQGLCRR